LIEAIQKVATDEHENNKGYFLAWPSASIICTFYDEGWR